MKPLNAGSEACTPISSSCVIWQGPDISCIQLCKGDAISDVVYKLATELCELLEQFDIDNYDLDCLNLACEPKDFQTLLQILIDKICALEDCCNDEPSPAREGCPDCVVDICEKFWYTNELGDLIKTMQLSDYVKAIGNRVCQLIDQIATINETLISLDDRITILENTPPPTFSLPLVTPTCVIPGATPTAMNIVLTALEQQFCALITATGTGTELITATTFQCANLTNSPQLSNSSSNMGNLTGWNSTVDNVADSLTNMWLTICDLRSAVSNIIANCCNDGCSGIGLELSATLTGTNIRIFVTGFVPSNFQPCTIGGYQLSSFTITDSATPQHTATFNNASGYDIPAALLSPATGQLFPLGTTTLNLNTNLAIQMTACFFDPVTGTTCQSVLSYVITTEVACPQINLTASAPNNITYTMTTAPGSPSTLYTIQLWTNTGVAGLPDQTVTLGGSATYSGNFTSPTIVYPTQYRVKVFVTLPSGIQECAFSDYVTPPGVPCNAPTYIAGSSSIQTNLAP